MYQVFEIFQGEDEPQYIVNLLMCSIDRTVPESWELKSPCGESFTIEEDDLTRLKEALGI